MEKVLLSGSGGYLFFFDLAEPVDSGFEDGVGSGYLQDLDVFGLGGNYDFLAAVLQIDVVGTRTKPSLLFVVVLSHSGLHAAEGNVSFGDFALVVNLKVVGSLVGDGVPGPTLGFAFEGGGLVLRKTNAIIDY